MAVVGIPEQSPWIVARSAFRQLLQASSPRLESEGDRAVLVQAIALDGPHVELLPKEQAHRIAAAMAKAAEELRSRNLEASDERDREYAAALGALDLLLSDMVDSE